MKYHLKCLVSLVKAVDHQQPHEDQTDMCHSIAFAKLVTDVEDELTEMNTPVLKLADLV